MSNINYASINENFPVAGQDNDTQVFRDNFDTIKTSLRYAKEELEVLQDPATGAARLNAENDFNGNVITNAKFVANTDMVANSNLNYTAPELDIDHLNGAYQVVRFVGTGTPNCTINFFFPTVSEVAPSVSKITLELYTDGAEAKTISFATSGGLTYRKNFAGSTINLPVTTSATNRRILEIWRYTSSIIYIDDRGTFT